MGGLCSHDLGVAWRPFAVLRLFRYDRLLRKVVVDCENKLRSQGLKHHLKIPISVVAQEEDFEVRVICCDLGPVHFAHR